MVAVHEAVASEGDQVELQPRSRLHICWQINRQPIATKGAARKAVLAGRLHGQRLCPRKRRTGTVNL